jgi:hypothetical protein
MFRYTYLPMSLAREDVKGKMEDVNNFHIPIFTHGPGEGRCKR